MGGVYKCERCGALGHKSAIRRAPTWGGGLQVIVEPSVTCPGTAALLRPPICRPMWSGLCRHSLGMHPSIGSTTAACSHRELDYSSEVA